MLMPLLRSRSRFPFLAAAVLLVVPLAAQAQQLEIVEAAYGAGNYQMNVAPKLRGMVQNNVLELSVDPGLLGGDPAPGTAKRLRVVYRYGGRQYEVSAGDYERLRAPSTAPSPLPVSPVPVAPAPANPGGGFSLGDIWGTGNAAALRIVTARYGDGARFSDVRDRLQGLVRNDAISLKVDNAGMGSDPAPAKAKSLEVTYEYRGTTYQTSVKEGATLTLPDANARAISTSPAPPVVTLPPGVLAPKVLLRVVSARYGGDNRYNDVRDRLQAMIGTANSLSVKVDNAGLGGDPAVGKDKVLEVTYEWSGALYATWAKEGKTLVLPDSQATPIPNPATPAPAAPPVGRGPDSDGARSAGNRGTIGGPVASPSGGREIVPIGNAGGLRIFYARYGAPGQEIDVRERLRPLLVGDAVNAVVGVGSMGSDPSPGVMKTVTVVYEFRGRTYEKTASDGQALVLP